MSEPLVTTAFVHAMARYNQEMNRRLYDAAARLSDEERRADRGAFWGSLHGTLNHILWGDWIWMSRFEPERWPKPATALKDSAAMIADFESLSSARKEADEKVLAWSKRVNAAWLADDFGWFSNAANRELSMPASVLVVHFFNHQTHHRGQAHALVTASGEKTGDTDLFLVL
jgi:uncharacterized damage-inducible protein DinB